MISVIPKCNRPRKWRLILNLSAPKGRSVNDAISTELNSIHSIDHAVSMIRRLSSGCPLVKLDLIQAYRAVPVHLSDQSLLAMKWESVIYIDRALPFATFGPHNFSALIDAMLWIVHSRGIQFTLHYPRTWPDIRQLGLWSTLLVSVVLLDLRNTWLPHTSLSYDGVMLWAATCVGLLGFLRLYRIIDGPVADSNPKVHLDVVDLSVDSHNAPTMVASHETE